VFIHNTGAVSVDVLTRRAWGASGRYDMRSRESFLQFSNLGFRDRNI